MKRSREILGVIIPDAKTPFDKAVIGGIAACADGEWTLMTAGLGTGAAAPSDADGLVRLCLDERVAGVFLRPVPSKGGERETAKILAQFRKAEIPVVLFDTDAVKLSKRADCDCVACSAAASGIAARLGGVACHLMLQRLADPALPPLEVLLDEPFADT